MKYLFGTIIILLLSFSCVRKDFVYINGRIENGDSVATVWVDDSVYTFLLDENGFFSGKINLVKSAIDSFGSNNWDIYLRPGEDLTINMNLLNISGSLNFSGSLGGINNYLKEQEMAVYFDKDFYALDEEVFVDKLKTLIDEKTELLKAKNFDKDFTELEMQRIRYSVGERLLVYPIYKQQYSANYKPGKFFKAFLETFSLNYHQLFVTKAYRKFLLDYAYSQGGNNYSTGPDYTTGLADYVMANFDRQDVRNFLLKETVDRYIWENNGVDGAEYLLEIFRRECTDPTSRKYIEEVVGHFEKLLPGKQAPDFKVFSPQGKGIHLSDFRGSYLYLSVWASWCRPCKKELPYVGSLLKEYKGRNIRFLSVSIDEASEKRQWVSLLEKNHYGGIQAIVGDKNIFSKDYMIISVPRFILIAPDGSIIDSNAPRPSGDIRTLLNKFI